MLYNYSGINSGRTTTVSDSAKETLDQNQSPEERGTGGTARCERAERREAIIGVEESEKGGGEQ